MGLCLSCLNGDDNDETTSLLHNQQKSYVNDYQEEEQMKQRQQELNTIVGELSDDLIDVTNFLNLSNENYDVYVYNDSDRQKVLQQFDNIDSSIQKSCKITVNEPLYIKF